MKISCKYNLDILLDFSDDNFALHKNNMPWKVGRENYHMFQYLLDALHCTTKVCGKSIVDKLLK